MTGFSIIVTMLVYKHTTVPSQTTIHERSDSVFKPMSPKTIECVETPNGILRGYVERGIHTYLGIPYGEQKRWQTAVPVKPWKGIRNAVQFGCRAFPFGPDEKVDIGGMPRDVYPFGEDCLNLNVWTSTLEPQAKKPVMVWFHGGGFSIGCAMNMQCYDGENLSRFGDVVVVSVNHRLNMFGFMDMSRFGEEYANSGNCGISDLVLALRWVHENISSFGGDPDNVTIFGQSGGGGKVRAVMQIEEACGLYHKAIVQSGTAKKSSDSVLHVSDNSASNSVIDYLIEKYKTEDIHFFESLPAEQLLSDAEEVAEKNHITPMTYWHPVANDWYPGDASEVGFNEYAKTVPVMVGCMLCESSPMRIRNKYEYTEEEREDLVRKVFPDQDADKLIDLFRKAWPGKCITDAIEMGGWLAFRPADIELADLRAKTCSADTYNYIFAREYRHYGDMINCHSMEIPMVFHNASLYPETYHEGLLDGFEDAVSGSWAAFAHTGNPNNKYLGLEWPAYKTGECAVMVFDDKREVRYDFDRELTAYRSSLQLHPLEEMKNKSFQID